MTPTVAALSSTLAQFLTPAPAPLVARAVGHTSELEYIKSLPRRSWGDEDSPEIRQLTEQITAWLRAPGGTRELRAIQAIALAELYYYGGLVGMLRVGAGKTDISFLAAVALSSPRPVLVIPAKLRKKTHIEFGKLAKEWRSPATLRIISYTELSRDYGDEEYRDSSGRPMGILELANPSILILEECHNVKNEGAACTKKVRRFMHSHPDVPLVALSGTMTNRSLLDYAHILVWALKQRAPVPRSYSELRDWASAIDVKVRDPERLQAGALLELATPQEVATLDPITAARRGFRRRLTETPGVVAYSKEYDGASLFIREITDGTPTCEPSKKCPKPRRFGYNAMIEKAFSELREWRRPPPDSTTIPDGMTRARHARELSLGFYRAWDPWPPEPWRHARAECHRGFREIIAHNTLGLDSAWQVANACIHLERTTAGMGKDARERWTDVARRYHAWKKIEPDFTPNKVAVWFDDGPVQWVAEWMKVNRGIVWVGHIPFGKRLSEITGAPYFGEQGVDASGRPIESALSKDGSIIASITSNREGRNLQEQWSDNLVTAPPTTGEAWQQLIGRTYREGQTADEVNIDVFMGCREHATAWFSALDDAEYVEESSGLGAVIRGCDKEMPAIDDVEGRILLGPRWW